MGSDKLLIILCLAERLLMEDEWARTVWAGW